MNTSILKCLVLLGQLMLFLLPFANSVAQTQPNIIIIVADDLGWNDVGYHGSEIQTPTMDRLAANGVELNRFYVHPSPTRSSLMTGKAALRLGFVNPLGKNNVKSKRREWVSTVSEW